MMKYAGDVTCVEINCAETLYAREDFQKWLNEYVGKGLATWHREGEPGDFSDIFLTYDHGEGSDYYDMPEECWAIICDFCEKHRIDYAVLWLKNLEEDE